MHEGLLRQLNEDEVRGVIAHELGHIKHKDYIVMTVLAALPLLAYLMAQIRFQSRMFSGTASRRTQRPGKRRCRPHSHRRNLIHRLHHQLPCRDAAEQAPRALR